MRHLDLFSGIGGFALGLRMAGGFETIGFCEVDEYCQRVLRKHWPDVPIYEDVTTLDYEQFIGQVDIITAGFPCQDISVAGKGEGLAGERSGLYRHLMDALRVVRPKYAIVENTAALLNRGLGVILGELSEIGYDAEWHCIPASAVGAPHQRDRVWIVAHADGGRREGQDVPVRQGRQDEAAPVARGSGEDVANANGERQPNAEGRGVFAAAGFATIIGRHIRSRADDGWCPEPAVRRVVNGLPHRVDRLRGLGNAVVPQIVAILGKATLEVDREL